MLLGHLRRGLQPQGDFLFRCGANKLLLVAHWVVDAFPHDGNDCEYHDHQRDDDPDLAHRAATPWAERSGTIALDSAGAAHATSGFSKLMTLPEASTNTSNSRAS
ncbi:MAG: hypothetical protein ACI9DF_000518 [Verrucomicrobiales bacterium]|jgi:hypothetical protein